MNSKSRRDFIRASSLGTIGLLAGTKLSWAASSYIPVQDALADLSRALLRKWADTLIMQQVTDGTDTKNFGGLMCPACKVVHGRVCDVFYPFLHLASTTKEQRYIDSATMLYRWMEKNVSQPDGSWINDPTTNSWKGITVFTCITLGETLQNHRALLKDEFVKEIQDRLIKAGDFLCANFTIDYGNINYPISGAYALVLLGKELNNDKFTSKGKELGEQVKKFFTKEGFIYGEGKPYYETSKKGCLSVDLGYNVEESLPSLVMYSLLTGDKEMLKLVIRSMQTHMEFMLPDGAWDNSWGTRNFKWTYWGSRTSDGCQAGYALMSSHDPRFYKVAFKNTELLKACTDKGHLYGGPHYVSHGVLSCNHHAICHMKPLASLLDHNHNKSIPDLKKLLLPSEQEGRLKFFSDIQTWLVSKGNFRATVTGYDREYNFPNGHPTGGAITMLWHARTGPILAASMNEYQMKEVTNMQPDNDPRSMPLTPRIELNNGGTKYMNISDLQAVIETSESKQTVITTRSRLVNGAQKDPADGAVDCTVIYSFGEKEVIIRFRHNGKRYDGAVKIIVPLIAATGEKWELKTENSASLLKAGATIQIQASKPIRVLPTSGERVFNFVPGLEAIPMAFEGEEVEVRLSVI